MPHHRSLSGDVAHLGERLLCTQEVRGSNPRISTRHTPASEHPPPSPLLVPHRHHPLLGAFLFGGAVRPGTVVGEARERFAS